MTYDETFHSRCDQYMQAVLTFPRVMEHEYRTAVEMMNCSGEENGQYPTVLHLQAGGIPLRTYLPTDCRYLPFETSPDFAKWGYPLCLYNHIPVDDQSIDRFIILASLHHASRDERTSLFHEVKRMMRPNGKMVLADVQRGSKQDRWLNEFVHRHNVSGHIGDFFEADQVKEHVESCGWRVTSIELKNYPWVFDDRKSMVKFTRELFGLKNDLSDETVWLALSTYFTIQEKEDHSLHLAWELLYLVCEFESTTSFPVPSPPLATDTPDDPPTVSK